MRNYNGVHACQPLRSAIENSGYVQKYTTMYNDNCAPDVVRAAWDAGGWAVRRAIKAWAKSEGISDYVIFRATDYLRDLHGRSVYEVYIRTIREQHASIQEGDK